MYKYKLVKKVNPKDPDAPRKWYATPIGEKSQSIKEMTKAATENTTTAPIEMEAAFELFGKYAVQQLLQGHIVRVGNIGTLRISFQSNGVEDLVDFNVAKTIKNPRILFTPSTEFRNSVLNELQFTNAGVHDEGVSYSSITDYKLAKGIIDKDEDDDGPVVE